MVKFKTIVPAEIAGLLSGRVVCDVCERHLTVPMVGKVVNWRGSVEQEYFSITFLRGVLTLSLVEREMLLGHNALNIAMVEPLASVVQGGDSIAAVEATYNYNLKQSEKDVNTISFTDVMVALSWRYAPNAKIDYDLLAV